jgi:endoglucanase
MSFNQTFVNAVRSTGGRNTYRNLIIQAYNTNITHAENHLKMPTDPTADRMFMEVHFYDPYDFALQESGSFKTQWGKHFLGGNVSNWGQEAWVDEAFGKMKRKFYDKGIPIILGEYGAVLRSNLTSGLQEHIQARNYYLEYVTRAAIANGMTPFYWDNGHTGNNGFGLFNRHTGAIVHQDALDALMKGAEK